MRRSVFLFLVALVVVAGSLDADVRHVANPVAGEYIIVLKDMPRDDVDAAAASLAANYHATVLGTMKWGFKGFGARMSPEMAEALSNHPLVDFIEENAHVQTSYTIEPLDSNDAEWNLDRVDNRYPIYSYKAYAYTYTGYGVRAYVLDSGIMAKHVEFDNDENPDTPGSRVEMGANEVVTWGDLNPPNDPCGGYSTNYGAGHGTSVASALGGKYVGTAKGVTLVPVKVATCNGDGTSDVYSLAICWGLDWVIQDLAAHPGKRGVISMSVWDYANSTEQCNGTNCISAMEYNITKAIQANIPVVVSANNQNNGSCSTSPARMGYGGSGDPNKTYAYHTITVGGLMYSVNPDGTYNDQRWDCPLYGCTYETSDKGSNYGPCVDIYAGAWQVKVAHINGFWSYRTSYRHQNSGTSFSAPLVAGLVARILQHNPSFTPQQVWDKLRNDASHAANDLDPSAAIFNDRIAYLSPDE